ncbi:MAG: phosphodiester glycosidase family protein [Clostridia bacterium]|nr:phosphodiester glycosidase family protein [Clostridia bacterium]
MKKLKITALVLSLIFVLACAASAVNQVAPLKDESSHVETEIYPGVTHAEINTPSGSSPYSNQHINVLKFDLKQRDLYLDVAYYNDRAVVNYSASQTSNITKQYNQKHSDRTAIAAINGDMWMVSYAHARIEGKGTTYQGYSDAVVKKELTVSRAFNIIDGEIYTTEHMMQETPYPGAAWSFGITDDFVPNLGQPYATIKMTNNTQGGTAKVDGINRLPANNAIVMYTDKLMGTINGFALDDAYEYLIEFDKDYKMCHGANVTGTIKAIYGPDSSENAPKINEKQMVITVRGTKVQSVKNYKVGDRINFTVEIHEHNGNDELWQRVQQCVGGNIVYIKDGVFTGNGIESGYPTTMVGYDKSGNVILLTMDGRGKGGAGASTARYTQLINDLDLYDAFILDGGGSATMVVASDTSYSSYKVVNTPSDGKERTVNNVMILAFGPQRAAQGDFDIELPVEITDPVHVSFPTRSYVKGVITAPNQASFGWESGCLKLTADNINTAPGMADPYVSMSYASITGKASANQYKYITYVYRLPETNTRTQYFTEVFCQCEGRGAEGGQSVSTTAYRTGKFEYLTFNPSTLSKWKGTITGLRIDFFGGTMAEGDTMYIHDIILTETLDEAKAIGAEIVQELNPTLLDAAFDELCYDDTPLVSSKAYTFVNDEANREAINFKLNSVDTISFKGWAQLSTQIKGFGYKIDNGELVKGGFILDRAAELEQSGKPGAQGYLVNVPVSGLGKGEHEITIYAIDVSDLAVPVVKVKDGVTYPVHLTFTVGDPAVTTGDLNADGKINNKDVVTLFRFVSGALSKDEVVYDAADVTGDGKINNKDVVTLFIILSEN